MTVNTILERRSQARTEQLSKLELFLSKQDAIRIKLAQRYVLQQEREAERLKAHEEALTAKQLEVEAAAEREAQRLQEAAVERERLLEAARLKSEAQLIESKAREHAALERRSSVLSDEAMRQSIRMRKRAQRQR